MAFQYTYKSSLSKFINFIHLQSIWRSLPNNLVDSLTWKALKAPLLNTNVDRDDHQSLYDISFQWIVFLLTLLWVLHLYRLKISILPICPFKVSNCVIAKNCQLSQPGQFKNQITILFQDRLHPGSSALRVGCQKTKSWVNNLQANC